MNFCHKFDDDTTHTHANTHTLIDGLQAERAAGQGSDVEEGSPAPPGALEALEQRLAEKDKMIEQLRRDNRRVRPREINDPKSRLATLNISADHLAKCFC